MESETDNVASFLPKIRRILPPLLPDLETLDDILKWRREMIRALRKGEGCYDKKLAEKLSGCCNRVGERCQLPMCPLCVHQLGSSLVVEMLACMGLSSLWKTDLQISVFFATVPGTSYPIGQLDQIDLGSIGRRIRRQYKRLGFPLAVSVVDISLIEDSSGENAPSWEGLCF